MRFANICTQSCLQYTYLTLLNCTQLIHSYNMNKYTYIGALLLLLALSASRRPLVLRPSPLPTWLVLLLEVTQYIRTLGMEAISSPGTCRTVRRSTLGLPLATFNRQPHSFKATFPYYIVPSTGVYHFDVNVVVNVYSSTWDGGSTTPNQNIDIQL